MARERLNAMPAAWGKVGRTAKDDSVAAKLNDHPSHAVTQDAAGQDRTASMPDHAGDA